MVATADVAEPQTPSAFVSHSSKDAALAKELCGRLEARGIRCWIGPRDVQPGRPYAEEIVRGIEACQSLVLLATADAVSSDNVLNEIEQAHNHHKTILTVMVGRPSVSRELSYYIARLHWIESAGNSMDDVASRLGDVLRERKKWPEVASAPTLGRRVRYLDPVLLSGVIAALSLVLISAGLVLFEWSHIRNSLAGDYRSLGWVTMGAVTKLSSQPAEVKAQVWLGDLGTRFQDVNLVETTRRDSGASTRIDLSSQLAAHESSGVESITMPLPDGTRHMTTCLTVPTARRGGRYTVTQEFAVSADSGELTVSPVRDAVVKAANNQAACN
jgi:hypothetical protein